MVDLGAVCLALDIVDRWFLYFMRCDWQIACFGVWPVYPQKSELRVFLFLVSVNSGSKLHTQDRVFILRPFWVQISM